MNPLSLKDLKQEFYNFLGSLSIEEIIGNFALMKEVERFDRLIQAAEGNWKGAHHVLPVKRQHP